LRVLLVYFFLISNCIILPQRYFHSTNVPFNTISFTLTNNGAISYEGNYWTRINAPLINDQSLWVIGMINDFPHLAISNYTSYYSPGPIINGQPAFYIKPEDSIRYKTYILTSGSDDSNTDIIWPSDFGAPSDKYGNPVLYNDVTSWSVYNSLDSTIQGARRQSDTLPVMPVEVRQLFYSFNRYPETHVLNNTVFMEFLILNKGEYRIDSVYIALWSDIDFPDLEQNIPAFDPETQTGYCWTRKDSTYTGYPSPAVGYTLLYGPVIPSHGDTAIFNGEKRPGFRNLKLSSFRPLVDFMNDTRFYYWSTLRQTWNIARGLDRFGNDIIDPITGIKTNFPLSGDPVTNTGWIYPNSITGGEAGIILFSGPFTMEPGDTQWVMFSFVPGLGENKFQSIINMRENAAYLHSRSYDELVTKTYKQPPGSKPYEFFLDINYPNPFNSGTTINFSLTEKAEVHLDIYDILGRKVSSIINEEKEPGVYSARFIPPKNLSSGVYFYQLRTNKNILTRKMTFLK
jgi:hypothetical protein